MTHRMSQRGGADGERGFNLVEVLIAMALLGTVLITLLTLFFIGRNNVYSGKQTSVALSIATHAMEDLSSRSKKDILVAFAAEGAAMGTVDVDTTSNALPTDTYANSILRVSSKADDIDPTKNDPNGLMKKWADQAEGRLDRPVVALVLTPQKPYPTGSTLTTNNATAMKIRLLVRWNEGSRRREVILDSAKVARP